MTKFLAIFFISIVFCDSVAAQEALPNFTASLKSNGKVLISWKNNYPVVTQISIQRSFDSTRNFTTLLTVPDPTVSENGFVDGKAPTTRQFYRLFIVLDSGKYLFSKSKRASPDTGKTLVSAVQEPNDREPVDQGFVPKSERSRIIDLSKGKDSSRINAPDKIKGAPIVKYNKTIVIKTKDSLIGTIYESSVRHFRDSVMSKTRDTLVLKGTDTILIKPFIPKEVYKISTFVFVNKDGNVMVALGDFSKKKYNVRFLELDATELFDLKEIRQPTLIVDKTNFIHAGWFRYELYEDGKLKEKNKLYIPKEF